MKSQNKLSDLRFDNTKSVDGKYKQKNDNVHMWLTNNNEKSKIPDKIYTYEEALDIAGTGWYSWGMLVVCSLCLVGSGMDLFGMSIIMTASNCDMNMDMQQKGITSSIPFLGVIVSSYPWGYFSDTRGRKLTLIISMSCGFVFAFASGLAPNWQFLAVSKFFSCAFSSAANSAAYTFLGESCPQRVRGKYLLLMSSTLLSTIFCFNILSILILDLDFEYPIEAIIGISYKPWRFLILMVAIPMLMSTVVLVFFYESPKFLANVGRHEESLQVLRQITKRNGNGDVDFPVKQIFIEEQSMKMENMTFFQSIVKQTVPLFKAPLLKQTLLLFYLNVIIYGTNNSFLMWFPTIANKFFSSYGTSEGNLCAMMKQNETIVVSADFNSTIDESFCADKVDILTLWVGAVIGFIYTTLNAIMSLFPARKKRLMMIIFIISTLGGMATNVTPEPISSMTFSIVFTLTSLAMGLTPSYFVELYPTSYRGMVSCLGILVARLSSFVGTNIVGLVILDHCEITYYAWSSFVFTGFIFAWFLPPDKTKT